MPKLPRISGKKCIQLLGQLGFVPVRQKGSHVVLKRLIDGLEFGCVVPIHKQLALGTLRSILRQAEVTPEEFAELLS